MAEVHESDSDKSSVEFIDFSHSDEKSQQSDYDSDWSQAYNIIHREVDL